MHLTPPTTHKLLVKHNGWGWNQVHTQTAGNLTTSRSGSDFDSQQGSGKLGFNVQIIGDNTKTLTLRFNGGIALNANTIGGVGIQATGVTVTFGTTTSARSFALGDFTLIEK